MELYQDIPRVCTAIAEWGACVAYLYLIKKERMKSVSFWIASILVLILQTMFLVFTWDLPIAFWIPCMALDAAIMFFLPAARRWAVLLRCMVLLCQSISSGRIYSVFGLADLFLFSGIGIWMRLASDFVVCVRIFGVFFDGYSAGTAVLNTGVYEPVNNQGSHCCGRDCNQYFRVQ